MGADDHNDYLGEMPDELKIDPPAGMVQVTRAQFLVTVGKLNVTPSTAHDMFAAWKTPGDTVMGWVRPGWKHPGYRREYFALASLIHSKQGN